MEKFWKIALGVAGLGAIASFVIWSIYSDVIRLPIFSKLTKDQTFTLLVIVIIFTFLFTLTAMIIYFLLEKNKPKTTPNPKVYLSVPENWTFEQAARAIAKYSRSLINFEGFSKVELSEILKPGDITAYSVEDALKQLAYLSNNLPTYRVSIKKGVYQISV